MSVTATPLEDLISEAVLLRLDGPALGQLLSDSPSTEVDDEVAKELAAAEGRLSELAELYADGEISKVEWMKARGKLEDRVASARSHLYRHEQSGVLKAYAKPGAL